MKGEVILSLYAPKFDDWFIIETSIGLYSFRLGGIKREIDFEKSKFTTIPCPFINQTIKALFTDNFIVYVETNSGEAIKHSDNASIDGDGNTYFGIFFISKTEFDEIKFENSQDPEPHLIEIEVE